MIINEFRARFLSSLITILSHFTDYNNKGNSYFNDLDKGFDSFRKNLETSVMKYK